MRQFISAFLVLSLFFATPVGAQNIQDLGAAAEAQINALRKAKRLKPVQVNRDLTQAAVTHANDMARKGFFSHTGSDGSSIGDRVKRQGYRFCVVAENIAKGQGSLTEVIDGWMNSLGHRRNILNKKARDFGLVRDAQDHWVMVLGAKKC